MYLLPKGNITCVNTKWGKNFTRLNEWGKRQLFTVCMYIYAERFVLLLSTYIYNIYILLTYYIKENCDQKLSVRYVCAFATTICI